MQEDYFYRVITFVEFPKETDLVPPAQDIEGYYVEKPEPKSLEHWGI